MKRSRFPSELRSSVMFFLLVLAIGSISRVGLAILYWDRVVDAGHIGAIFLQGLRFDVILASILTVIPAVLAPWVSRREMVTSITRVYFIVCIGLVLFMEAASPTFIAEYDSRPNMLFVEYLKYPKEVFSMLWVGYRGQVFLGLSAVGLFTFASARILFGQARVVEEGGLLRKIALSITVIAIAALGIRSSFGHRPANPSMVAFSSDMMVNDLALNSTYSLLYAIYSNQRHERGIKAYGRRPWDLVVNDIRSSMYLDEKDFLSNDYPSLHDSPWVAGTPRHPNIVIILEESLGAEYVGALGGIGVTPELDQLVSQGIWFDQLYATGTRSVRGIEAVITGFTPTPARSVVKLPKSQSGFFTIAQLLKPYGYDSSFIYGGEAHFDNMRQFFMGNGFDRVIEQKDYASAEFTGSWGVSDEDLFRRAHREFEAMHARDQPFFSLVFTSSNHSPFEFPEGKVQLYEQPQATVNNAVKYADYALGQYIDEAKHSGYWNDTLFLIVADHNSRVRGAERVPVEYFHIPALIMGGAVKPLKYSRLASQVDLLPTLLGLAGIDAPHPATGIDLLRPDVEYIPGRAIMQYGDTQAYLQDDRIVILAPDKPPEVYEYRHDTGYSPDSANDVQLVDRAVSQSIWSVEAYQRKLYRLTKAMETTGREVIGLSVSSSKTAEWNEVLEEDHQG